jgi:hypothetical protein
LQENLKYFVKFANLRLKSSETRAKGPSFKGEIDDLKTGAENALKSLAGLKEKKQNNEPQST